MFDLSESQWSMNGWVNISHFGMVNTPPGGMLEMVYGIGGLPHLTWSDMLKVYEIIENHTIIYKMLWYIVNLIILERSRPTLDTRVEKKKFVAGWIWGSAFTKPQIAI